mgnify:FL=1
MASEEKPKRPGGGGLLVYYVGLVVVVVLLVRWVPDAGRFLTGQPGLDPTAEITSTMAGDVTLRGTPTGWASVWVTAGSALSALFIMIPVAWTYMLIKSRTGYEE